MERTDKYISPLAMDAQKAARNEGSDVQFLVSPWSPPLWMKDNGDMNHGGHLLDHYRELWAQYFVTFIKKMAEREIKISFVTIQNEPAAVQTWDSCEYSAQQEGEFAAQFLGPALEKAGLGDVKIYIWDHNRDLALELGDLHHLLGDTNVVSITISPDGHFDIDKEIEGDSVGDVLSYVEYDAKELITFFRSVAERAVRRKMITPAQRKTITNAFEDGIRGYTYFER